MLTLYDAFLSNGIGPDEYSATSSSSKMHIPDDDEHITILCLLRGVFLILYFYPAFKSAFLSQHAFFQAFSLDNSTCQLGARRADEWLGREAVTRIKVSRIKVYCVEFAASDQGVQSLSWTSAEVATV